MKIFVLTPAIILTLLFNLISAHAQHMETEHMSFSKVITKELNVNYLISFPKQYTSEGDSYPLLLFLHGAGERGNDLEQIRVHGPQKVADSGTKFPFIIISPQVPEGGLWQEEVLLNLLDEIIQVHNVDKDRIYLTGLSMGGYGVWDLAMADPGRFAAVAPIAGGGNPVEVCRLKDTPVWVFHGDQDTIIPPFNSTEMVRILRECDGNVKLTIYPDTGHDSWTTTYDNPAFYEWLLSNTLK
ncbi:MAG: prolyl oligopeptidase family serine peptidase [Balneolales bacterium]